MITKYKKHHRIIATVFLLIFFPTLVPNNLFASNNGPKSPEAASFEPVDATDMVNLITGQYSYVLPLLNVPSPEGGYPIALGYHAGIAMDQEASWTGLGWNVNPGAIDRNVNGYPDDYNVSQLNEFFWDRTHTETRYTASLGFTSLSGLSVGVGFNWGSNQALGGSVSVGIGPDLGAFGTGVNASVGTDGGSIGIGVSMKGGLSYGASINTNGDVGVSAGYGNNDAGISIGYNTNGTTTLGISGGTGRDNSFGLDVSLSSSGVGISGGITNKTGKNIDGGAGAGMFVSFNNSISVGDYSTSSSGWMIPIIVPTPIGIFSGSFGKQEFKYWMGINVNDFVTGPIYFYKGVKNVEEKYWAQDILEYDDYGNPAVYGDMYLATRKIGKAFMDINEVPINTEASELSSETDVAGNNLTFPGYDNFSVSGQGVSGSMSATIYKNGALFGLDGKENKKAFTLKYADGTNASDVSYLKFNAKPQFDFDNEITGYLGVTPALFNSSATISNVLNYYSSGVNFNDQLRRKTSSYIEYYTNEEINTPDSYAVLKANGFLQPSVSGFDRSMMPKDGIGAFKVTTVDGKTYHYSLPVYNHEIITRTNGAIPESPEEWQSYFEKRQLEPFATHWVLTAVTGPDFVDNGDGMAGDGDLGYWTSFEYGKWTDAFIWKNPYKKDKLIDDKDPSIQTWIRGRKQLYYLDKIKTRTHTALFIKGERQDAPSPEWSYNSAHHDARINNEVVNGRFIIPSQKQLRLEKIILLKNTDNTVDKTYGADANQNVHIHYNDSKVKEDLEAKYNMYDNVLDTNDNWQNIIVKAVKVIDFGYDYSLVPGDNRLSLRSVDFKGKGGTSVLPPYKFDYINDTNTFNIDNKDGWGYLADKPETFSLNKITTPQGGTISINYENTKFRGITDSKLDFSSDNPIKYKCSNPNPNPTSSSDLSGKKVILTIGSNENYPILIGQSVDVNYSCGKLELVSQDAILHTRKYLGPGKITNLLGDGKYEVTFDDNPSDYYSSKITNIYAVYAFKPYDITKISLKLQGNQIFTGSAPRVASLHVADGYTKFITDYKYGQNEDGVGYASYIPYSQNTAKEVPYSAELPAPRVMYEYVTVGTHPENVLPESKMRYKFNIMKEKSADKIKFGSFYEIVKTGNTPFYNDSAKKEVSINSYTVKENFAALGQLLEVATINSKNQLLSKVYSTYYDINEIPNNMGVTQESYQSYKEVDYLTNTSTIKDKWIINSSTRIKYPSIIKSSTEQKSGYTYTTQFNDYDLISGVSKEQVYTSSDGQSFKTKTIPAYIKYSEMGSKAENINNKNMLSQTAANYSYIYDATDAIKPWKETGVGITTWSNIWSYKDVAGVIVSVPAGGLAKDKIWRKHKSFVWNGAKDGNGIFTNYNSATDDGFNWTVGVGSQPAQWKQTSEVTLYDHFSVPLEMKDINKNLASNKMGDGDTKVMATGNAGYNEMFFAGAENITGVEDVNAAGTNWLEPEVKMINAKRNKTYFHTGKRSIEATSSSQFGALLGGPLPNGVPQHRSGKYRVSVWVKKSNAAKAVLKVNDAAIAFLSDAILAGDWQLKTAYIDVPAGACTVYLSSADTSSVYFDDLMIRPLASSITGYVYNEWDELTHIIGNNGLATRFEYDAAGRLVKTYSEIVDYTENGGAVTGGFKLTTMSKINYKNLK